MWQPAKRLKLSPCWPLSPQCQELPKIVEKNWVSYRYSTTKTLSVYRVVVSYWCLKNLRDPSVRAKIPKKEINPSNQEPLSTTDNNCKTKNCRYCKILDTSGRIKSHTTNREYNDERNVTCKSSNVIYCISCTTCSKQNVGQTKLPLMDRSSNHFTSIQKNDGKNNLSKHFNEVSHHGIADLKLHIVDFIHEHPNGDFGSVLRDQIKFHWIQRLHTQLPHGINIKDKSPQWEPDVDIGKMLILGHFMASHFSHFFHFLFLVCLGSHWEL